MVISPKKNLSSCLHNLTEFPRLCKIPSRRILQSYLTQTCTCRRAMVNKIWCRKVARAWLQAEPSHPRAFSEPRCQNYVGVWYLIYRCLILLAWLTIIFCSILEFGSYEPMGNNHKWLIYLTNWDLCLGAIQASLGVFVVLRRWKMQKLDFDPQTMSLGKVEKIYWFLYTSTCTIAIGVTVSYWCAVHDPKIHHLDPLNIMLHVCNSALMIIDYSVTSIPLRLRHFWWPLTIATPYVLFTIIYYVAGGLDKKGLTYIYKVLNWEKPGISIAVCLGAMTFLVFVHCLLCFAITIKERLYGRASDEKYIQESPAHLNNEQLSRQTNKQVETV